MAATTWDPALYLDFDDHRSRPFHDLVARVGAVAPRRVVDLGCGPGHLTGVLSARWPGAIVRAVDSSPEMVAAARARGVDANLGDVADWMPAPNDDVVVTNAVLHWVPGHLALLERWIGALPNGAFFALQVPGNFSTPSHTLVRELLAEDRFAGRVEILGEDAVPEPAVYGDVLAGAGAAADAWETTYLQRLTGTDPVLRWIEGTTLRPVRDALDDDEYAALRSRLAASLRAAYPPGPDGTTTFPFRRIFAVARVD